ncbi:hypothetical protein TWF730_009124 [Orbilia blumenaviensis]|uniref:Uncharacterized protein n=1 Tax=Orbilia blumenaviensis TaxID=1796055 RepID=A0AAV9UYM4_9PEZI
MPHTYGQGPSKAQKEPDDLEDYEDSSSEEGEIKEEKGPAAVQAESFLSRLANQLLAADVVAPSVAPTARRTGASGSLSTRAASTDNIVAPVVTAPLPPRTGASGSPSTWAMSTTNSTMAPVTAPLAFRTGASGSLSTRAMSTEESDSSSLSMASGSERTALSFGSSVSSLSSASGVHGEKAPANVPQATGGSEGKTSVVPAPAPKNDQSSSHPVVVPSGSTAQKSLGNQAGSQAVPMPSSGDDDMMDIDGDDDIEMPDFDPDFDPDVEMPDAPPRRRRRSRGCSAPRRDSPLRRLYWGLPCASVRRIGEKTADKKNAIRAFSKVLSKKKLLGRNYQS